MICETAWTEERPVRMLDRELLAGGPFHSKRQYEILIPRIPNAERSFIAFSDDTIKKCSSSASAAAHYLAVQR